MVLGKLIGYHPDNNHKVIVLAWATYQKWHIGILL